MSVCGCVGVRVCVRVCVSVSVSVSASNARLDRMKRTLDEDRCACGNFARTGHLTCNACRPENEVEAERERKATKRALEDAQFEAERNVIDALPECRCPCGSFARKWVGFDEFESRCDAKDFQTTVKKYKRFVKTVEKDSRCNACAKA